MDIVQLNKSTELEQRTSLFGEQIIELCKIASKNIVSIPVIDQLVRSGTSIGTNYCEANGASSRKDFRNKIMICKKESKETMYWLRIMARTQEDLTPKCRLLWKEAHELTMIFSKAAANTLVK